MHLYANGATTTLANAISASDTNITIQTGTGNLFPTVAGDDFFYATIEDVSGVWEIVKCTAHGAGAITMTIVRGEEGTTATAFSSADRFEIRMTAGALEQFFQRIGDTVDGGTY
jgi:hypothetical protein